MTYNVSGGTLNHDLSIYLNTHRQQKMATLKLAD